MRCKERSDARHQIVVTVVIRPDDHAVNFVAFATGDLAKQGDGIVAGGKAFGLSHSGDRVLFDLVALGGIKRHVRPP